MITLGSAIITSMTPGEVRAHNALKFIIPKMEESGFKWVITGGFACYAYGVKRPITDIDIDVNGSKDMPAFKRFYKSLRELITQPLEKLHDQNYDNYNFEITINEQVIDICPMAEMNIFNKNTGAFENFYKDGFPRVEIVDFFGLQLSLLAKDLVMKNKEMLVWQRDSDRSDIEGLKKLL